MVPLCYGEVLPVLVSRVQRQGAIGGALIVHSNT